MTGEQLKAERLERGYTKAALGLLLGATEIQVHRAEGRAEVPAGWAEALASLPPAAPREGGRGPYRPKIGKKPAPAKGRRPREKAEDRAPVRASEEAQPEAEVVSASKEAEREQVLAVVREEVVLKLLEADVERAFELLQAEDLTEHATHLPPPLPAPRAPERCPVCHR